MLKIGAVAELTGVGAETIRYYEKAGVLSEAERAANGYRLYNDAQVRRLRFIKRCRELGFSLDEVRSLLCLANGEGSACEDVRHLARNHLANVRRNIRDLEAIETVLNALVEDCSKDGSASCPILEALFDDRNAPIFTADT